MARIALWLLLPAASAQTLKFGAVTSTERASAEAAAKPGVKAAAIHRPITPKMLGKGKWKGNVWKLKIVSKGAAGIRLLIGALPPDSGTLVVKGAATPDVQTFDGKQNAEFWTAVTHGDSVWLEFTAPQKRSAAPVQIQTLSHIYP